MNNQKQSRKLPTVLPEMVGGGDGVVVVGGLILDLSAFLISLGALQRRGALAMKAFHYWWCEGKQVGFPSLSFCHQGLQCVQPKRIITALTSCGVLPHQNSDFKERRKI